MLHIAKIKESELARTFVFEKTAKIPIQFHKHVIS